MHTANIIQVHLCYANPSSLHPTLYPFLRRHWPDLEPLETDSKAALTTLSLGAC